MATNLYFSQKVRSEQNLYEDLIIESLKIFGQDAYYLPRTLINRDEIFGEDSSSKFDDAYLIEAYIENTDGFEGAGDLYQKFGLEIRDQIVFSLARRAWEGLDIGTRPKEGDLIYFPLTSKLFQITFVEHETPFYQTGALPTFDLTCELFTYSDESLDTGIDDIDVIERQQSFVRTFELSSVSKDSSAGFGIKYEFLILKSNELGSVVKNVASMILILSNILFLLL